VLTEDGYHAEDGVVTSKPCESRISPNRTSSPELLPVKRSQRVLPCISLSIKHMTAHRRHSHSGFGPLEYVPAAADNSAGKGEVERDAERRRLEVESCAFGGP
jgi:hypothetical protein